MPNKSTTVSIVTILVIVTIGITSFWYISPSLAGPNIDDSWLIVCHANDSWDPFSAQWVRGKYGGTIINIALPNEYNEHGQNLFIIGGSAFLSEQAPWLEANFPLAITRPSTFPDVGYTWDDDLNRWEIRTPTTTYYPDEDNEIGFIARGYDYTLRRWIVACLGYNWWGTAYGAKLICTQWDKLVIDNSYVIFKCTAYGGVDPTQWSFSDFDGIILEYGG